MQDYSINTGSKICFWNDQSINDQSNSVASRQSYSLQYRAMMECAVYPEYVDPAHVSSITLLSSGLCSTRLNQYGVKRSDHHRQKGESTVRTSEFNPEVCDKCRPNEYVSLPNVAVGQRAKVRVFQIGVCISCSESDVSQV